ncbi:MAG: ABC transporter substrate-binding protein [Planctomycetes bacterium]|nr:ABC transporter substrate-binding protein [Planctomycetota bacterium]
MNKARTPIHPGSSIPGWLLAVSCFLLLSAGCHKAANPPGSGEPAHLKVAYIGLTCEAPIFVAYEKGFFKDEGLDVELVKTDWDGLRDGLGLGRFDANHTLVMYLLKPVEQGLDVKMTGGIHTGCLRVQAGMKTEIHNVEDLRGKRIGVPTHMGSPPYLFASRVLAAHGMDPAKDVTWVVYPPDVLGLAVDKGEVDAVADSEPIGSILLGQKKVRTVPGADQAVDPPYRDEYCCAAVVSGKLAARDPAAAAKVTRALLKGAKWVGENPTAAAQLSVEKKYLASSAEFNAQAIAKLKYVPGVARCRDSLVQAAKEMKAAGLLEASTDPNELAQRAWLDLDGVSDDWVNGLKVEKVAGGGRPPLLDPAAFAALFARGRPCCSCCCLNE